MPTDTIWRDLVGAFGIPGVLVLALVAYYVVQRIKRERNGGSSSYDLISALSTQSEWRTEVTRALADITKQTSELTQLLRNTRHDILAPLKIVTDDLEHRTNGIEHVIHEFPTVKQQVDDLHRRKM